VVEAPSVEARLELERKRGIDWRGSGLRLRIGRADGQRQGEGEQPDDEDAGGPREAG
jgi:hypothetical protein